MIEFFLFAGLFFSILQTGNLYYFFVSKNVQGTRNKKQRTKSSSKSKQSSTSLIMILLTITVVIAMILGMSYVFIHLFSRNFFIIYMGIITYGMLIYAISQIISSSHKLFFGLLIASILLAIQLWVKIPLYGGLLLTFGYISVVSTIFISKIVPPKILILSLIAFTLYDFSTVFITPVQMDLAGKTINNLFPAALVLGNTTLGTGDVLFALIMTIFTRTYYSTKVAIIMGLLLALPMVGIGIFVKLFPEQNIGLPYLIFMTPLFLAVVYTMKQKGYKLR